MKFTIYIIAAAELLCGCSKQDKPQSQVDHWRDQAYSVMLQGCTNEVTGLTKVIDHSIDDQSDQLSNWKAKATVEYINHFGGIDRTNVYYRFGSSFGGLYTTHNYDHDEQVYQQQIYDITNHAAVQIETAATTPVLAPTVKNTYQLDPNTGMPYGTHLDPNTVPDLGSNTAPAAK